MRRLAKSCECGCGGLARPYHRFIYNHHQSRNRKYDTDKFIRAATLRHGGKYLYPRTIYQHFDLTVTITCPMHGDFCQKPKVHLKGNGCYKCGRVKSIASRITYDTARFIKKAADRYDDRYTYDKVIGDRYSSIVTINCRRCGTNFTTTPRQHLRGKGCGICSKTRRLTQDEFIAAARAVHGDLFNYDQAIYVNQITKLLIICKKHGPFYQTPRDHIHCGAGCPNCKTSKGEKVIERILKGIGINYRKQYRFDGCLGKKGKRLPFDFAITKDGRLSLIEYQGVQHYQPIGGVRKIDFINIQERDEQKRQFCLDNNLKLLEIPYYAIKNGRHLIADFINEL